MTDNPLGKHTLYPASYDPGLLFPIARLQNREKLGLAPQNVPFRGYDSWRAYELSWLDERGKPVVATGEFIVPSNSTFLTESKSLKLYLNSLNQMRFLNVDEVQQTISRDLSNATQSPVIVYLYTVDDERNLSISKPSGECLDQLDVAIDCYLPDPKFLSVEASVQVTETLYSNLFRSNCPVTSQPDWGTVVISYAGAAIDRAGLLRYLISFRAHEGFHEDCAERIFTDILRYAVPRSLSVSMNFLRRGGLEINPVRTNAPLDVDFPGPRYVRQ
ncbi:MAG: NADPH-dependent 7-cyano-7-deazaguanine reductase QueF [Gammaproteobacteria bacterium RIFCSPLOWO2_02_FULL_57_10]|nr:MAG: NADPH-dependent 7-cyano-7-deazaguanine reductase QueF [Gammaproteobacteria bacterium RIFCSPLOWO2_02_FULL_57_10]